MLRSSGFRFFLFFVFFKFKPWTCPADSLQPEEKVLAERRAGDVADVCALVHPRCGRLELHADAADAAAAAVLSSGVVKELAFFFIWFAGNNIGFGDGRIWTIINQRQGGGGHSGKEDKRERERQNKKQHTDTKKNILKSLRP